MARQLGRNAPSQSTVARVLVKEGKVRRRRRPPRVWSVDGRPHVEVAAANDLWTIDLKGWWRARNGQKCEPLTVRDAYSRRVLCVVLGAATGPKVRRVLERLFRKHGTPMAMQSDNGPPFASTLSRGGLTQLSVWLVSLGIRLVRSRLASPQDNGGHERMHKDLSELQFTPARSLKAQQRQCDRWMLDFNYIRPHDTLGGPAEVYRDSPRRSPSPGIPSYPPEWITRRVNKLGNVKVNGDVVFLSTPLVGQLVGLKQENGLLWRARFFDIDLGTVEMLPPHQRLCD